MVEAPIPGGTRKGHDKHNLMGFADLYLSEDKTATVTGIAGNAELLGSLSDLKTYRLKKGTKKGGGGK